MSPAGQPKPTSSSWTVALAPVSSPATKMLCEPGSDLGIDHHVGVHRVERLDHARLRKRALDLLAEAVGVADRERRWHAGGEVEWIRDVEEHFPVRFSASADTSASMDARPEVAFTTSSPNPAASEKLPLVGELALGAVAHSTAAAFPALREPIITSWPSATSLLARVRPTAPVPSTPILIPHLPCSGRAAWGPPSRSACRLSRGGASCGASCGACRDACGACRRGRRGGLSPPPWSPCPWP